MLSDVSMQISQMIWDQPPLQPVLISFTYYFMKQVADIVGGSTGNQSGGSDFLLLWFVSCILIIILPMILGVLHPAHINNQQDQNENEEDGYPKHTPNLTPPIGLVCLLILLGPLLLLLLVHLILHHLTGPVFIHCHHWLHFFAIHSIHFEINFIFSIIYQKKKTIILYNIIKNTFFR